MKKTRTKIVIGNWKMNPSTVEKSYALFTEVKKSIGAKKVLPEVVVAPPFLSIAGIAKLSSKTQIALGAQDAFYESTGAYTGEIGVPMLKAIGVTHVIVGHSERRALGDSDEYIAKKIVAVLQNGLCAVVCVGEKVRDVHGDYFSFVEAQLKSALAHVESRHIGKLVIAYEPVWAIGTQKTATPENVQEMKLFIQKIVADRFNRAVADKIRIIYGGSVTKDTAQELLQVGDVDGFLVGGASLKPLEFAGIVRISHEYGNKKS